MPEFDLSDLEQRKAFAKEIFEYLLTTTEELQKKVERLERELKEATQRAVNAETRLIHALRKAES